MTTTTIVGIIGTAAYANEINFDQSTGSTITVLNFSQTGNLAAITDDSGILGNEIIGNTSDETGSAKFTGSAINTLNIIQNGDANKTAFEIDTDDTNGDVEMVTKGSNNASILNVSQESSDSLQYFVAIKGSNNSVTANVTNVDSTVKLQSVGSKIIYDITQTGAAGGGITETHSIIANVTSTDESSVKNVEFNQTGILNDIQFGSLDGFENFTKEYAFDTGNVGLTLHAGASVEINQSADNAKYIATNTTVPVNGSLTINQTN